ncbi:response regulator [Brevundimonas sp. SL130]|uniref:response regulator n=1 Tax=Brevundimonas sp. SL130 TaxID=2995143 RepID=UPI00226C9DE8|nr:response regulator [Brevundimonas sp. SL130]WAC59274.1 response regulator [Brevundimonas sp. SL130]
MSLLRSLNVLVVDDQEHMLTIASTILRAAGIRSVYEASDGAAALSILGSKPVDLALVDYNMFPLDGDELTRRVRTGADGGNIYLPIIMMSGHAEKSRIHAARDAGVTEFLAKPLTANSIIERIKAVILNPRPFVKIDTYCGPCRRRKEAANYDGPLRRGVESDQSFSAA